MKETLLAGFSRQKITPDYSAPLAGYGNMMGRMSEKVLDDLFVTCVAITSGEETILLYSMDIIGIDGQMLERFRSGIKEATGIAGEKVFFSATHTHSAPHPYSDLELGERFQGELCVGCIAAAKEALADRAPAKLLCTTQRIPGMNFVRHYVMGDGTYHGSNFGSQESGFVGHAAPTDPRMILVQLQREEKPSIVLVNWQAHNDNARAAGFRNITSSYVGKFRENFEKDTGMHFCYICGASGNQNPNSLIQAERHDLNWIAYGRKLADYAIDALPKLEAVKGTAIKMAHTELVVGANHAWDRLLPQAKEVVEFWHSTGDSYKATDLAKTFGLTSCYHASSVLGLVKLPETMVLELNAFTIGELAFVTSTNEAFSNMGLYVRSYAPYDTVVFVAGNRGYLPCAIAYDYRAYEADTAMYAKGSCEKASYELVRMLKELKG